MKCSDHINLVYVSAARLPTEKAHGLQIMKMCEAFAEEGYSVELVIPRRGSPITDDPFVYYDVKRIFSIRRLPVVGGPHWGRWGFRLMLAVFSEVLGWWLLFRRRHAIVYSRNDVPAVESVLLNWRVFFEVHKARWNLATRVVARRARGLIAITHGVKQFYTKKGVPDERIMVAPDGVDLAMFDEGKQKNEARSALGLSQHKIIAVYTGHLYVWKGVETLARAAAKLPKEFEVVFVGGVDSDVAAFRKRFGEQGNIRIVGQRPHRQMPTWLTAADMLVLPNTARDDVSRRYTSPMKLFEYMAAHRPIVASDLPSIREVLDTESAYLVAPDAPDALSETLVRVRDEPEEAEARARRAREQVEQYTWQRRANEITQFMNDKMT